MRHTTSAPKFSFGSSGLSKTSKLLLLSVLVLLGLDQIQTQVTAPICPNLAEFGIKGLSTVVKNTNPLCPGLETTCCGEDHFNSLKQWWELEDTPIFQDERILESRRSKKERQIITIKVLTHSLLKKFQTFLQKIQNFNFQTGDPICITGAQSLTAISNKFYPSLPDDYLKNGQSCWSKLDQMNRTFLCSVCDPNTSDFLDIKRKYFRVETKTCENIMLDCVNLVSMNQEIISPYLKALSQISRCNQWGSLKPAISNYETTSNLVPEDFITNCKNTGDCTDLCENSIVLGGELSPVLEGDDSYILGVYKNSMDFIKSQYDLKQVPKLLRKSLDEKKKILEQPKNTFTDLGEVQSLGEIKKKRKLWERYDEPAVGRESRILAVDSRKGFLGNPEPEKVSLDSGTGNRFKSAYPGRYMILISEAEFNRRFKTEMGIPPGGRLIKGRARRAEERKNKDGRILKKYGYQVMTRKLQLENGQPGHRMAAERILPQKSQSKSEKLQPDQMRKLEALEGARTALRSEARSLIDWSQKFDDFIGKLKSKVKVLSAGLKVYSIKMYFDYDAYRFTKLMSTEN